MEGMEEMKGLVKFGIILSCLWRRFNLVTLLELKTFSGSPQV
jgi:hypothetical protein